MAMGCNPDSALMGKDTLESLFQPELLAAASAGPLANLKPWGGMTAENGLTTTSISRILLSSIIAIDNSPPMRPTHSAMSFLPRHALLGILGFAALSLLAGCEEKSSCITVCIRVAECRREPLEDEQMLGGKTPHSDDKCRERCEKNPDGFTACEEKRRTCPDLLSCTGRF